MLKKVEACSYLIAYDVAGGAIYPSRIAFRIGFAMKAALSALELYYRGGISLGMRNAILKDMAKVGFAIIVMENLFSYAPLLYGINVNIAHIVDQRKFVIDFTSVAHSEFVTGINALTFCAMFVLSIFAAERAFILTRYNLSTARFLLVVIIPITIFMSGFIGFMGIDFNKIILNRAGDCMKLESVKNVSR